MGFGVVLGILGVEGSEHLWGLVGRWWRENWLWCGLLRRLLGRGCRAPGVPLWGVVVSCGGLVGVCREVLEADVQWTYSLPAACCKTSYDFC